MTHYLKTIILSLAFIFNAMPFHAQHHSHEHSHSKNEIGISGGGIYFKEHKDWGFGTHVHYFHTLDSNNKWSLGGEFEGAWTGDDNHFTLGGGIKYQILEDWSVSLLPGITFYKHDDAKQKFDFSLHFETVYDLFYWEKCHFGPAIDYSWSKEHSHFSIGVHFAYCF